MKRRKAARTARKRRADGPPAPAGTPAPRSYAGRAALAEGESMRLDVYVARRLGILTRSQIAARRMRFAVDGAAVKRSFLLTGGEALDLRWDDPPPSLLLPEDLPLDVLYEDARVIVVNKAQGMVVHPGAGNRSGTLMNALLARRGLGAREAAFERAFIVHRLDKDTSGVIICAWDDGALRELAGQFKRREVRKTYLAVTCGIPREREGVIRGGLRRDGRDRRLFRVCPEGEGKAALTRYRVLRVSEARGQALVLLRPRTGRTHQLRVHLHGAGCPIAGDILYGKRDVEKTTLMLHARSLAIRLPGAPAATRFSAPLPRRFKDWLATPP